MNKKSGETSGIILGRNSVIYTDASQDEHSCDASVRYISGFETDCCLTPDTRARSCNERVRVVYRNAKHTRSKATLRSSLAGYTPGRVEGSATVCNISTNPLAKSLGTGKADDGATYKCRRWIQEEFGTVLRSRTCGMSFRATGVGGMLRFV